MNDLNQAIIIVGPPQHGKTTKARQFAADFATAGGWVVVHDPNRQFRDLADCYEDAAEWRAKLVAKQPMCRIASVGGAAADVTRTVVELGRAHNQAGNVKLPLMLVYDESSLLGSSGASYIGESDNQLLSNRRHWGIATLYNVQRPTALTEGFYTLATDVIVFSQPSVRRTAVLEEYLGLKEGALTKLVGGPKFQYIHWRAGEGVSS